MSYAVANMKKFKLTQVNGLGHHDERKTDHHRNQEIDVTKSSENYTVVPERYRKPDNVSLQKFIQQRISEGRDSSRAVRKDAVALTEWVVGSDHQFFESLTNAQTKSFFEDAYAWFANRYGAENIPYATVHMDETTPHMHMGVIPLTNGRLSAKSLFNRKELRSVQAEFPEYLKSRFWKIERGQKGSQHRHLSVEEYKKIAPELQNKREQLKKDLQGYQLIDVSKLEPETIPQQVKTGLFKTETQYVQTENYILTPKDYERLSQRVRGVSDVRVAQESIWEIKQRLDAKKAHLEEREKSLDHREERIEDSENVLAEYNQLYRTAEEKTTKVEQLTKENKQLKHVIQRATVQILTLKKALVNVVKAVGLMKYSDRYLQPLDTWGERLVDAIANYTSKWLNHYESPDLAKDVDSHVQLSKGINDEMRALEPHKAQQQRHNHSQGMERGM